MGSTDKPIATTWRSTQGDLTDEEWELIADLIPTYSGDGRIGRPTKWAKRDIVNGILYVAATGCQWRALPSCYPHWNTVHRYHVRWSENGVWERVCKRLREQVREREGRDAEPSAGVIDARSVRGASTVTAPPGDSMQERRSRAARPSVWSTPLASSSPWSWWPPACPTTSEGSPSSAGPGATRVDRGRSGATADSRRPSSPPAVRTTSPPRR